MTQPWSFGEQGPLRGTVTLPGDKSVSHRAYLLNALGRGVGSLTGLNPGADVEASARALRSLGVRLRTPGESRPFIEGRRGRLRTASDRIDCGNSGTTMRVLAGLLAAQEFTTTLDGDASLRGRPMGRIAEPLRRMGARVDGPTGGKSAPLILTGGPLRGGRFELPVASAQVKSCILVAAAAARVEVDVVSPGVSRDHTERMLAAMGAEIEWTGTRVHLGKSALLRTIDVAVPADPSAAALVCAAVVPVPGSMVRFERVMLNPTRSGFLRVLRRMGVGIRTHDGGEEAGEPVGTIVVAAPEVLNGTRVTAAEIPTLIDEVPALAAVAAFAAGSTRFTGVSELRVKESDRIGSMQRLLGRFGIESDTVGDDLVVHGGAPRLPREVDGSDDHRITMAACGLVAACVARSETAGVVGRVADVSSCEVSFPGFPESLERLAP